MAKHVEAIASTTQSTAEFAADVGVSKQAVLKAIADGAMPAEYNAMPVWTKAKPKGQKGGRGQYRFHPKGAWAWWERHRGEKNNVSGHGGKREEEERRVESGEGKEWRVESGERRSEGIGEEGEGEQEWKAKSGKRRSEKTGEDGTREQRRRAGQMLLREIIDEHGNVDRSLVPRLEMSELKRYVGMQQGLNREMERKVREGQLIERTSAQREWMRRCAAAAAEMAQMAARASDTIRGRLGIDDASARVVREVLDTEVGRTMSLLSGGGE